MTTLIVLPALLAALLSGQEPDAPNPKVKLFIPYKEYSAEENRKVLQAFDGLRVADVSDGMDGVGLANVGLVSAEIKPLWRDTENFTHRIIGIAVTARYVPTNKRETKIDQQTEARWYKEITTEAFQAALFPGCVLVIDGDEDGDTRTIGSTNIRTWRRLGALGVVTSGAVGDTDEIIHHKVPLYYKRLGRGYRPGRNELESVNRPVTIGGVLVRPGDIVVADGDGVIVAPRERALEIAAASRRFLDNVGLERFKARTQPKKPDY
jgi:regulator of RNase E activity RraA